MAQLRARNTEVWGEVADDVILVGVVCRLEGVADAIGGCKDEDVGASGGNEPAFRGDRKQRRGRRRQGILGKRGGQQPEFLVAADASKAEVLRVTLARRRIQMHGQTKQRPRPQKLTSVSTSSSSLPTLALISVSSGSSMLLDSGLWLRRDGVRGFRVKVRAFGSILWPSGE